MTGKFISFEGLDGSGKSTQIELLKEHYCSQGKSFEVFREPGGTEISERIRSLLLHESDEMASGTELLLFSAARYQIMHENVLPALEEGKLVVLDRFYDSTSAYQGYGRKMDLENIAALNTFASHQRAPDATFYLRISPETRFERKAKGTTDDRMERSGDAFFERVCSGYDTLAQQQPQRIHIIDAERTIPEIQKDLIKRIDALYK